MPPRRNAKAPIIDTTQENLVIVESPAKAKTIKKYLGNGFEVVASMWHIRDLPKKWMGIDIEHDFATTYEVSPDKKAVVSALKKAAKTMRVRLATDEDREGEAIARHIGQALKLDLKETPRIVFHEITQDAITAAVSNPRKVDMQLVDAQQARRVLDRLVGFELSPVLWKKIKPSLSAGRVQSVAVRLLVEREREILAFEPTHTFKVTGKFTTKDNQQFPAELNKPLSGKQEVENLFAGLLDQQFIVSDVEQKPGTKNPSAPFTTSTLQQEASRKMWSSVSRTMQLAQRLYEAGHITYMRTDSVNLSKQALASAKKVITAKYGSDYVKTRNFSTKSKGAQEAHEAIRPTRLDVEWAGADEAQKKLYHLIWQRTLASQMAPAALQKTNAKIDCGHQDYYFKAKWEVITFPGFLAVYDGKVGKDIILPELKKGDYIDVQEIVWTETLSKAPARYGEASLVKKLEELWIGRPSTYAPTIATIQNRWYVEKREYAGIPTKLDIAVLKKWSVSWKQETKNVWAYKWKLVPTDIGMVVTDFLVEHFADILEYKFTAKVEEEFDHIAHWKLQRKDMIATFYSPFHMTVESVTESADRASGERVLWTDPETGKIVKARIWRYGPLIQIGESDDDDKKFAQVTWGYSIATITLDQALTLFELPRELGEWNDKIVKANIGRFWPYVQWWSVFASIKDPDDPYEIEYERAVELVEEKIQRDKERTMKTFMYKDKEGVIMKARWSPVIKRNRKTIKLPKDTDWAKMTQKQIEQLIEAELETKKKAKKPASKKKTVKKKATS